MNKKYEKQLTVIAIFLLLKYAFTIADASDLIFLLKPTNIFVGLLTGSHSVYIECNGYYHETLNIIINKSCSGFNFWLLSFLSFAYLKLPIPTALGCAYLLTIFANTSRIFASIAMQSRALHEAIGIITYLSFLILAHCLMEKF